MTESQIQTKGCPADLQKQVDRLGARVRWRCMAPIREVVGGDRQLLGKAAPGAGRQFLQLAPLIEIGRGEGSSRPSRIHGRNQRCSWTAMHRASYQHLVRRVVWYTAKAAAPKALR